MSEVLSLIEPINNNDKYKEFTLRNNKVMLTYQKVRLPKEEYINWVELNIAHCKGFSVAHEEYDNEEELLEGEDLYHTHVLLHFAKQPCWTNVLRKFDYVIEGRNFHPNIRLLLTPFHWSNCVEYLKKFDTPFTNIIMTSSVQKEEDCLELISAIRSKKHFKDCLVDKDICYKVMLRMNWAREIFNTRDPILPKSDLTLKTLRKWQRKLYDFLLKPPKKREIFWVWGNANTGKSSFLDYLFKRFTLIYGCNKLNDFYNIYNNEDIIVYDMSFASSKKLEQQLKDSIEDISSLRSYMLNNYETLSNKGAYSCSKYQGSTGCITSHLIICSNCPASAVIPYLPDRIIEIKAEL